MGTETDAILHENREAHECGGRANHGTTDARVVLFPETRWTLVLGASGGSASIANDALQSLAEQYRPAVCQWFRRAGVTAEDAEDLSQEFVLDLFQGRVLGGFTRRDSRFRVFLQTCLRNFLRDDLRRRLAQKRGGGTTLLELDESRVALPGLSAIECLDDEFALLVHRRAIDRVRTEWDEKGLRQRFNHLEQFMFSPPAPGDYEATARSLGITLSVVKKTVFDLRQAYYQAVRQQILQTVSREEVAGELSYLVEVLCRLR